MSLDCVFPGNLLANALAPGGAVLAPLRFDAPGVCSLKLSSGVADLWPMRA